VKYFGDVDLFTVGTADNRFEDQLNASRRAGELGAYQIDTNAAIGGRIGALYPVENLADFGLSWGYISGPNGSWNYNAFKYQEVNRRFFRLLAEAQKTFKINDKFSLLGGAGLGVAWGRQEFVTEYQYANRENGVVVDTFDQYFHGLTWELSAGVTYKATEKLNVDLGVRYAGFPHAPNAHDVYNHHEIPGMDWNSFGIFTGVHF
jgi:opacity protein-like surface antigen